MLSCLVEIAAQEASGAPAFVRLASDDVPTLCHLGGGEWDAALIDLPSFAYDFFGGAFNGQITAPRTSFSAQICGVPTLDPDEGVRARFADAQVKIWVGDLDAPAFGEFGPLSLWFSGQLASEPQIDDATRTATFEAAVDDAWLDEPLLELFTGEGGIEGPADLAGQVKSIVFGNARFCSGRLIDRVNNVWLVSNGSVQAINAAYDRLGALDYSGDHDDLAALIAADIPAGAWASCRAQGLVRLGAPPDGRVSFDVSGDNGGLGGYVRLAGGIIARIAEMAGGGVHTKTITRLDTERPFNKGFQLTEQTTAREQIQSLADSVAAVSGIALTGKLFVQPLSIGSTGKPLNPDGTSEIAVLAVEELAKSAPNWRLATEAEITTEVHSAGEVAFAYRWQGVYSSTRVYRVDDVVTGPDGAAWAYINATASAGAALPISPALSNTHWENFQAYGGAGIEIDANGLLQGIKTTPTSVANTRVALEGPLASRPAFGAFIGQLYVASDTGEQFRWNGIAWRAASDLTSAAQRTIEPEFSSIEIKRYEAGNSGNRTVGHFAKRGTSSIDGGTWSLPQVLLGSGSASVNATSGLVTLSSITQSGTYTIRYTHTDGITTDLKVTVSFFDQADTARSINASPSVQTWSEGQTTLRTAAHTAIEGSTTLSGGTWSLVLTVGGIVASIDPTTGTLSLTSVTTSGNYTVRYTHTDSTETELTVNVIFYPANDGSAPLNPDYNILP